MSIVRVGLAETKHFSEGYEAIFGKKKEGTTEEKTETSEKQDKTKQDETAKPKK